MADDGASQQAATIIVTMDIGRHVDGKVRGPRHATEEHDEPQPDLHHVEAEHERDGNQLGEIETVCRHFIEMPIHTEWPIKTAQFLYLTYPKFIL